MSLFDYDRFSPRLLARIVGVIALAGIATGAFGISYVQHTLIVPVMSARILTLQFVFLHQVAERAVGDAQHVGGAGLHTVGLL